MNTPTGSQANRRVFLSRTLTKDVRLSGTADRSTSSPRSRRTQEQLGALIVDYGARHAGHRARGEGITNTTTRTCWGDTATTPDRRAGPACTHRRAPARRRRARSTRPATSRSPSRRRPSRSGASRAASLDSSNRNSLWYTDATPRHAEQQGPRSSSRRSPTEHIFKAGHQIGDRDRRQPDRRQRVRHCGDVGNAAQPITLDTKQSKVIAADPGRLRRRRPRPAAPTPRRSRRRSAPSRPTSRPRTDGRRPARRSTTRCRPRPTTRTRTRS